MPAMINYLSGSTDFFTAPASTKHHNVFLGGLAEHSLSVFNAAVALDKEFGTMCPRSQIIVAALLHDVCKTNYYCIEKKWRKDYYGKWESYDAWVVKDSLPLGHGEKSLYIISRFLELADAEAAAIRWHMGAWTPGVTSDYATQAAFNTAVDKYPLVSIILMADHVASRIIDSRGV